MTKLRSLAPILPVRSVPLAIAYYGKLGFTSQLYQEGEDYAFLEWQEREVHLRRAPNLVPGENPCGLYFYLHPGTAASLEAEFRAAGVDILSPLAVREWKMNEFMLSDPDGNLLRFGESTKPETQVPH